MKTPLCTEVDFSPGHTVLDGDPAPPRKGHSSPFLFSTHVYCGHGRPSQLLLISCVSLAIIVQRTGLCNRTFCFRFGCTEQFSANIRNAPTSTRSSAIVEGPRDAVCPLKSCERLHNCTKKSHVQMPAMDRH